MECAYSNISADKTSGERRIAGCGKTEDETGERRIAGCGKMEDETGERRIAGRWEMEDETGYTCTGLVWNNLPAAECVFSWPPRR